MIELVGTLCLGAILLVGALIVFLILRYLAGRKDKPAGTYDSPKYDSGGSIGGMNGGRAYDDPKIDSGATIGGQVERRSYDHPDVGSGGSIGGGPRVGDSPRRTASGGTWESTQQDEGGYTTRKDNDRTDSPDIKSGGSFGG